MPVRFIFFVLVLLTPLFFTNFFPDQNTTFEKRLWDSGHIIFFMLFALASWPRIKLQIAIGKSTNIFLIWMLIVAGVAISIEVVQFLVGRSASWSDLRKDMLGAVIVYQYLYLNNIVNKKRWNLSWVITVFWLCFELYPLAMAGYDQLDMRREFPTLADFESSGEMLRWTGGSIERVQIDLVNHSNSNNELSSNTNHALKVYLDTKNYTGVVATGLYRNWSTYHFLYFEVLNPNDKKMLLNVKVEDKAVKNRGMQYNDRYNGKFTLQPGYSSFRIPIKDIVKAPAEREMELTQMSRLSFFFYKLQEPTSIYIDNVMLIRGAPANGGDAASVRWK